jgi:hypothetical protein
MKNSIILFSLSILISLSSCGYGSQSPEAIAIEKELHKIDSISVEIDEVVTELDDKSKELDEAISEMEKTLNQ